MKLTTTTTQFAAINAKFNELRAESGPIKFPAGARPSAGDLWTMATLLVIEENS